jgi:hypothetical protein
MHIFREPDKPIQLSGALSDLLESSGPAFKLPEANRTGPNAMAGTATSPALNEGNDSNAEMTTGTQAPDNRTRFFEHNKDAREILLRRQAGTDAIQNALDVVFASTPWQEQRGELDRFQLQGLIATIRDEDGGESFHCKFPDCQYKNKESTNAVEHIRGYHFGNRPFLCTAPNW